MEYGVLWSSSTGSINSRIVREKLKIGVKCEVLGVGSVGLGIPFGRWQ